MLTENGIIIERFQEILSDIEKKQQEKIDPAIVNRDDQILSEINVIISDRLNKANEFLEAIRDCWDVAKAEGIALDNLLALKKVFRIPESRSSTNSQIFTGNPGVTVPANRLLRSPVTGEQFQTTDPITLSLNSCYEAVLSIPTVTIGEVYSLVINDISISYTTVGGDTEDDILDGLQDDFDAYEAVATPPTFALSTNTTDGTITVSDVGYGLRVIPSSNIATDIISARGRVEALVAGPNIVPQNTLTQIVIPIRGITSTTNLDAFSLGRFRESDEEFRLRGIRSVSSSGTATVPAITSSLFNNVSGVQSVLLVENDTHLEDGEGRPPHSYEVIVVGGDEVDIGRDIWRTKPSSIKTIGNTEVIFADSNGNLRTVYFTRPTPQLFAVQVTYSVYDEELFPISGTAAIRQIVTEYVDSLGVGVDFIPTRVFGSIYANVSGIDSLLVEIQPITTNGETPDPMEWQTTRYAIPQTQYASTSSIDVYVVEV